MKKLALTIAIVLGLSMTTFAGYNGGLFQRGETPENTGAFGGQAWYGWESWNNRDGMPALPIHAQDVNQNAPLGSGIALLLGLGGAYLVAKKRREE